MLVGILLMFGSLLFAAIVSPFLTMLSAPEHYASVTRIAINWVTRIACVIIPGVMLITGVLSLTPYSID